MLRDIQRQFMQGVLDGQAVADILPPAALSIYANNARVNFTQTLMLTYPVICRLVGEDYFRQCAREYQRLHPSRCGDLQHVGDGFSDYLSNLHRDEEFRYLADVARLEWAYQEALIEFELPTLELNRLAAIEPKYYLELRFMLQPSARVVESSFPVLAIWEANATPQGPGEDRIDLAAGDDRLLLLRTRGEVRIHRLDGGELIFLTRLLARDPFACAVEAASEIDPEFDPSTSMQKLVALRAIVDFYL